MSHDVCAYAACTLLATHSDDAWDFCLQHYREHRADLHGEPWPKLRIDEAAAVIKAALIPAHGTEARYKRHLRAGEQPCPTCTEGYRALKNPTGARRSPRYRWAS